jgi:hypothetical protein
MASTMVLLTACAAAAPSGGLARHGSSAALPACGVVVSVRAGRVGWPWVVDCIRRRP